MNRVESPHLDSLGVAPAMRFGPATRLVLLAGIGVSLLAVGCSHDLRRPPETVHKHAQRNVEQEKPVSPAERDYPEHIAPPPAYGNKVVMAESEGREIF